MMQEIIKKDYNDFYKHGDTEKADKFIGFLSRIEEVRTKVSSIYNNYMGWCKQMAIIPVSSRKFRELLQEHGYRVEIIGTKFLYVNAEYRYLREDTTSKVAYLPKIKEVKNDENENKHGSLCTHTDEPRIELPGEEIPLAAVLSTDTSKEEKAVKENNIEDLSKLTQIQMIELLQEAERQKFEQRMQKFERLKEEIIEADFSNQEVLAKMQELL